MGAGAQTAAATLLDEGAQGPLTLLAAPAGYGKTLLLASWAAPPAHPAPWPG